MEIIPIYWIFLLRGHN
uniref:Uncharacterized protein n=1 Tax=Moniliophthora roreri TaxID=221103 RepID=A0A0W0FZF4_MONRR